MKKLLSIFFILFSVGVLFAQNLNFKDTNALKTLLCSHAWIRYYVNPDSSFSDKIMDSIKFYPNHNYYKSARPTNDSVKYTPPFSISGRWHFVKTGKILRSDSATNCISVEIDYLTRKDAFYMYKFVLVDWHRVKGSKFGKISGNLDKPFLVKEYYDEGPTRDIHCIWQPRRQFKKSKQK